MKQSFEFSLVWIPFKHKLKDWDCSNEWEGFKLNEWHIQSFKSGAFKSTNNTQEYVFGL